MNCVGCRHGVVPSKSRVCSRCCLVYGEHGDPIGYPVTIGTLPAGMLPYGDARRALGGGRILPCDVVEIVRQTMRIAGATSAAIHT